MQLFKRILLSLFPEEDTHQSINPASMFISFISTKEFFSVINRKIVESYKLNLFDVTWDPFEFKIGLWKNIQIKQNDIDNYYGYCSAANMNGYKFYNPGNIGNSMSLLVAIVTQEQFRKYPQEYFLNFLYTCYLLIFIFAAKIKTFPFTTKQENYNRFIEVFFNFYGFIFGQTGQKIDKEQLVKIKKELSQESEIFFCLFYTYQKFNTIFWKEHTPSKDYYIRLLGDDIKKEDESILDQFIKESKKHIHNTTFWGIENKFLQQILPADILMRYVFLDTNIFLAVETILGKLFDNKTIDWYLKSFLKDDNKRDEFIEYITNYRHFKKHFFLWIQKYLIKLFQRDGIEDIREEEMDDISSRIGENPEKWDENIKIPERIKKESRIMEKILNFYITFLGGFRIARSDNFFLRLHKNELLNNLTKSHTIEKLKEKSLYFYWGMLYLYGKNIFYYKYISENVRLGRQRFYLPYKSTSKKTYSNREILRLFEESNLATLLQDIHSKDLKIYSKNKKILSLFKEKYGSKISELSKQEKSKLISEIYKPLDTILYKRDLIKNLRKYLNENDIYHIKENLYTLDFWINQTVYKRLLIHQRYLKDQYDEGAIIGILGKLRETLFGYLMVQIEIKKSKKELYPDILRQIYLSEILHIGGDKREESKIKKIILEIEDELKPFLEIVATTDDNPDFLKIGIESRSWFVEIGKDNNFEKELTGEDSLRMYGYFKNITYYNKRFLLPN